MVAETITFCRLLPSPSGPRNFMKNGLRGRISKAAWRDRNRSRSVEAVRLFDPEHAQLNE
jgi:hypothetical protein